MSTAGRIMLVDMPGWQGGAAGNRPYPNVGIAYLVPGLERAGFAVHVVDMNNDAVTDDDLVSAISAFQPFTIGFSVKTATARNAKRLGAMLKHRFPNIPIIVGGPHATVAADAMTGEPWLDIVVIGEAEETLPELCGALEQGAENVCLPGVITRGTGNVSRDLPALVDDLDALAFPDYSRFSPGVRTSIAHSYPLVTSRGCVYRCTYCSVPKISGRRLRRRSLDGLFGELRYAIKTYAIRQFEIIDDAFNTDMDRAKQFCSMLIKAGLGLKWSCPNGLRADRIDPELAALMARSGCLSVMVGVESADPTVLAAVQKGETIDDIEKGVRTFQEAGISVGGYFIIGLPGDSYAAQERSVDFVKRLGMEAHFNMLVPYPKTELWSWAVDHARFLYDIEGTMHFSDCSERVTPALETDAFPASERIRAYEMVNTRLRQFHMLVPFSLSRWERIIRRLKLVWVYDRGNIFKHLVRSIVRSV